MLTAMVHLCTPSFCSSFASNHYQLPTAQPQSACPLAKPTTISLTPRLVKYNFPPLDPIPSILSQCQIFRRFRRPCLGLYTPHRYRARIKKRCPSMGGNPLQNSHRRPDGLQAWYSHGPHTAVMAVSCRGRRLVLGRSRPRRCRTTTIQIQALATHRVA